MWKRKHFKGDRPETAARQWIKDNSHRYQCQLVWVQNGCAVEYRKLRMIG